MATRKFIVPPTCNSRAPREEFRRLLPRYRHNGREAGLGPIGKREGINVPDLINAA